MLSPRLMDCSGGLSSRDSSVDRSQRTRYEMNKKIKIKLSASCLQLYVPRSTVRRRRKREERTILNL